MPWRFFQCAIIVDSVAIFGNKYHAISPWRKKKILNETPHLLLTARFFFQRG
jgi:hypothetical protein